MKLSWLVSALSVIIASAPASAATYTLTVTNEAAKNATVGVKSIRVKGATPESYPVPGREPRVFSIEVTMPDGLCQTKVTLFLEVGEGRYPGERTEMPYNVCSENGIFLVRK
jgi:hypothetical protein